MNSHKIAGLPYPAPDNDLHCQVTLFLKGLFKRCKEGNKDADIQICHSLADIKTQLDVLNSKAALAFSYSHLSLLQRSLTDVGFRYVIVSKDGKPVLFVYFQLYTLSARNFNLEKKDNCVKHILQLFFNLKKAKVLVMGNALRTEALSFCYNASAISYDDAIEAIAAVADKIAVTDDCSAVILPGIEAGDKTSARKGYTMPWEDHVMEMNVNTDWKSINDYASALSRKYKTRTNKVLAARSLLQIKALTESEVKQHQQDINRLFAAVLENQSFVFTQSGAAYITQLKELYKDDFEVTAFFKEGKFVAFYSAFVTADAYELFYVGFDTALNGECQLYFNILLAGLERSVLLRKSVLKLGRTSFDAKASLGAKPRQVPYLIRFRKIPDVAIKWFTAYFSSVEDNKWKLRNPLKTD
ncbi:MAG: hypothetical protein K9G49_03110 [Taibaiella sp.]|nr:hypothetical protein [Taibaiella sp.]